MNKEQMQVLAAFDVAMQGFVTAWEDKSTTPQTVLIAYGAASIMLVLVRQMTDANEAVKLAAKLLNDAAEQIGVPPIH